MYVVCKADATLSFVINMILWPVVSCVFVGRSSKAIEELQVAGMGKPNPAETRAGDTAILNVVEAYCNNARLKSLIRKYYNP